MHKTLAIVQARMGSTRLPGKSLMPVWSNLSVLELLLVRLRQAKALDGVVVATTQERRDDAIAEVCSSGSVACFRGPTDDVLRRFALALGQHPAQAVVRVCADNPLVDPQQVDALVRFFWENRCDIAYNLRPESGFPDGVGAEILSAATLRRLDCEAMEPTHREHVTTYLYERPGEFRVLPMSAPLSLRRPDIRLDVDYEEDLAFLKALCQRLPNWSAPLWSTAEIIATLDRCPHLLAMRHARSDVKC